MHHSLWEKLPSEVQNLTFQLLTASLFQAARLANCMASFISQRLAFTGTMEQWEDRNAQITADLCDVNDIVQSVDLIAWRRLAVSSQNVTIYISRDYTLLITSTAMNNNLFLNIKISPFPQVSLGVHTFIWKWDFIHMQIKLIFMWISVHQVSLWKRGFGQLALDGNCSLI